MIRGLDPVGLAAGAAATLLLAAGIWLGSRNLRHYDPVLLTYTFGALLLPAAAVRAWKRRGSKRESTAERADFGVAPAWMNRLLTGWQRAEAAWLARANLPAPRSSSTRRPR